MRAKPSPINTPETTEPASRGFSIDAHRLVAPKAAPGLHLVATPIGNLGDITLRALQTLAGVDVIACEDTRITRRLTERYDISAQLKQYHEHNAEAARPKILERLSQGGSIALVSDAGTPLISDPGYKLVREGCAARPAVYAPRRPPRLLRAARPVLGAGGAVGRSAANRPLLLRRLSAFQISRAEVAPGRACAHRCDAGDIRLRQSRAGHARRARRDHGDP